MKISKRLAAILFTSIVFLLFNNVQSLAQTTNDFATKGTVELGGNITYLSSTPVSNGNTGGSQSVFMLEPYVGYFPVNGFEIGVNPLGITIVSNYTLYNMFFAASYNFRTQDKIFPFLEGQIGYTAQSSDNYSSSGVSWGIRGGIKIAVTGNGLLNIGIKYQQITLNPSSSNPYYSSGGGRDGENDLSVIAGFTIWL